MNYESKAVLSALDIAQLSPIFTYDSLAMTCNGRAILSGLRFADPTVVSITWIRAAIELCAPLDWYGDWSRDASGDSKSHFIMQHPKYYGQYLLAGGSSRVPISMTKPDGGTLAHSLDSKITLPRTKDDWWRLYPVEAILLWKVTTLTLEDNEDQINAIKASYFMFFGLDATKDTLFKLFHSLKALQCSLPEELYFRVMGPFGYYLDHISTASSLGIVSRYLCDQVTKLFYDFRKQ